MERKMKLFQDLSVLYTSSYDGVFEIALCLTEKNEGMQFCQTQIWPDFLSRLSFCQDIPNEFLSQFKDILSNTGGYIDSVLFCQSLQSQ